MSITKAPDAPSTPPTPRHQPMEIAPETFVIQATQGEGTAPQAVHMNSMLIRGSEPVVVDTGCPAHREQYLEDLFSLVDPQDVRWVFISHDDVDHYGNLHEVMDACPNATLVATWFLCERLAGDRLDVAPTRWRWVGDGESFEAGDRTLTALRPPLYDSPTTRGLYDHSSGVYWASDCFATPVERGTAFVADLDPQAWAAGFAAFQAWNSPWVSLVEPDAFAAECRRVEQLRPSAIATAHGPTIEASHVQRAFEMLRAMPGVVAPAQPDQSVLDAITSAMAAGVAQ
ncbi:MAG: MBL fold metallo-hydrolase [Microthrixaceae bacterium]